MDEEFAAYTLINLYQWYGIRGRAKKTLNETAKETNKRKRRRKSVSNGALRNSVK